MVPQSSINPSKKVHNEAQEKYSFKSQSLNPQP